jgi:hypothetical protein
MAVRGQRIMPTPEQFALRQPLFFFWKTLP